MGETGLSVPFKAPLPLDMTLCWDPSSCSCVGNGPFGVVTAGRILNASHQPLGRAREARAVDGRHGTRML